MGDKSRASSRAIIRLRGTTMTSLVYRQVMTRRYLEPVRVAMNSPRMSKVTSSRGPVAGNELQGQL